MRIVLKKDIEKEQPIRIFNPDNPYAKKTKYSIITLIFSPIVVLLLLFAVSSVFYSAELNTLVLLVMFTTVLLSSIFVGYYGGRYSYQADHKLFVSLLLILTFNPFIWFGIVLSKIIPTLISYFKAYN